MCQIISVNIHDEWGHWAATGAPGSSVGTDNYLWKADNLLLISTSCHFSNMEPWSLAAWIDLSWIETYISIHPLPGGGLDRSNVILIANAFIH